MPINRLKLFASSRGDTLVEVIFATATLSLVIVVALSVMNQGTASSERAVEGTFVRQSIDSQADMLRYARDNFIDKSSPALWTDIVTNHRNPTVTGYGNLANNNCQKTNDKAFYLQADGTKVSLKSDILSARTFATPGQGLWVEATSGGGNGFVDFYIYACWDSPVAGPKATSGTIVRLYAPTS